MIESVLLALVLEGNLTSPVEPEVPAASKEEGGTDSPGSVGPRQGQQENGASLNGGNDELVEQLIDELIDKSLDKLAEEAARATAPSSELEDGQTEVESNVALDEDSPGNAPVVLFPRYFGDGSAAPNDLQAQPPTDSSRDPQFLRGPRFPRSWLEIPASLSYRSSGFGLGGMYFLAPAVGIGGSVVDIIYLDGMNLLTIMAKARFIVLPNYKISPFLSGGAGSAIFSDGNSTRPFGYWRAAVGLMVRVNDRLVIDGGVSAAGLFPDGRFDGLCYVTSNPCSLRVSANVGLIIRIGPSWESASDVDDGG